MNDKLGTKWKETTVAYFKELSQIYRERLSETMKVSLRIAGLRT
jgi:hypothetical protein